MVRHHHSVEVAALVSDQRMLCRYCSPGRFFAANELKAMLAYIVINYDLKMAGNGERPKNMYYAGSVIPSPSGEVSFRKRLASI